MNTHPFDTLQLPDGTGALIFTPCPGTKDADMQQALGQLKAAGATRIITLMPAEEMAQFGVNDLPDVCKRLDLAWHHLPIADDCQPGDDFRAAWSAQGAQLLRAMADGETLAIHCVGGSGRTGLMATILMLESGIVAEQVIDDVRALRPKALRKPAHVDYLADTYQVTPS